MAIRIQKKWSQLGSPQNAGAHNARGVGKIVDVTEEHLAQAQQIGDDAIVVLGHVDAAGMTPHWEIVEIRAA
jgi:hypothetical protein